ncbi:MAG: tetratricopeptide repeat-containing sulfotransferase family protein [Gammaproteobacteria bacterium]
MSVADRTNRGSIDVALKNAADLLAHDPRLAEEQAQEILKVYPDTVEAKRTLASAYRLQKMPQKGLDVLAPMFAEHSESPDYLHELALCLGGVGQGDEAVEVLRKAIAIDAEHKAAWDSLGHQLAVAGDQQGSREAFQRHFELTTPYQELVEAGKLLREGKQGKAETIVRELLKKHPTEVTAIKMLSDIGLKMGQLKDASHLLERCLELAPNYHAARHSYAIVLMRRQEPEAALEEAERLLALEPDNPNFLTLKASILGRIGNQAEALEIYEKTLKDYPSQPKGQLSYGHTLHAVGRLDECIEAYKECIRLSPEVGEAYWSLANLKTYRFSDEEIQNMREQVTTEGGDADDQAHLAFALGKALEDRKKYDESFRFYKRGNAIRRIGHRHNLKVNVLDSLRQIKALPEPFFEQRKGWGCQAPDPIFVVGLPRAGSTLLEQILASHSRVEGTAELMDIIAISRKLGDKKRENPAGKYPEILAELTEDQVRELGEGYLETTRIQRTTDAPFFIDKLPNNFQHIGLIHLILPNSKIIDARRHPMGGCFSGYKQLFARGQTFTYGLEDIGKYYRDYVRVMDHWDKVLPGRVHRVQYEEMVSDTESQIRALLHYCDLDFEEQCLRFYETERSIRTPSAEQVRKPIYKEGMEQWRNFEAYLDPLKEALGPEVRKRYSINL